MPLRMLTAILGAVVTGFDAELGDGIGRGRNSLVGETLVRGPVGVVVNTVEEEVIEFAALTVDIERSVSTAGSSVFKDIAANPRNEGGEVSVGA